MKKKILIIIYIILIFVTLKLVYNYMVNSMLISKYNNGEYTDTQAKALLICNFPQGYIANYNYGNILYKNEEYENAIEQYEKALKGRVPKYKECNIRINYALAICETVQVDEKDEKSIQEAIKKYQTAINVLTEKGCANKDNNNGHNKQAETLKNDIQKEINRLKKLQKEENNDDEVEEDEKEEKDDKVNVEEIKSKIQNIKEDALQKQKEKEEVYKYYGKYDYNKVEKNW